MATAASDLLIGRLVSVLENEASYLLGIHDAIKDIKQELVSMRSFLEDAEINPPTTQVEKNWAANVKDIVLDVEDIIDEFMYNINGQQSSSKFKWFVHNVIYMPINIWVKHKIATKLQKINRTIKAIPERNQRYAIQRVEGSSSQETLNWRQRQGESAVFAKEEVFGIEEEKELLMGWLMNEAPERTVFSLFGMGGSGKTTLVANTCNSAAVKSHFDCFAWVTLTQTYVVDDLLRRLIKEFYRSKEAIPKDLNALSYKELLQMLVPYLESKRYLVVLDDVWDHIKLWKEIKVSLPDCKFGSRIVITTRNENIDSFSFGVRSKAHHMKPLGNQDAWLLFCKKAFSDTNNQCPPYLEKLVWELVKKCEGLPLAIEALGGLMSSTERSISDWLKVLKTLNWHLNNHPELEATKRILLLSFNALPYTLKRCFLYCSLFPEDYLIQRKRLIRLWVAEGFVEQGNGKTPEEMAEGYLMELTFRGMLQGAVKNSFGRLEVCKMHDLMRELALSIAERERFCIAYDGQQETEGHGACKLSIQKNFDGDIKSFSGMSRLRSLLVFASDAFFSSSANTLFIGSKLLKVLDLEDMPLDKLPNELVKLFNLRYLSLKGTLIRELPKSIGRLRNLETLNIHNTKIVSLPNGVTKCQNLRHLLTSSNKYEKSSTSRYMYGTRVPLNISRLKRLQVLGSIQAESEIVRELGSMTQLKSIGMTNVKEADGTDLCGSIQKMRLLRNLFVIMSNEEECLRMDALSSPPPLLRKLILDGKLKNVPHWFCTLNSLTELHLNWSRLSEDVLPSIATLPNLSHLELGNAYDGEKLCFYSGFAKLSSLLVHSFPLLKDIIIEKGVMPQLSNITFHDMKELKKSPEGIEFLSKLDTMILDSVPIELIEGIRGEESVDRPKVRHIPNIIHYFRTSSGRFEERLS